MVGFGFGGVLALHLAAGDERVAGVACLGTPGRPRPADRATPSGCWPAAARPASSRRPGSRPRVDTWAKELSVLHPTEDAALLKGRPLLVVHGSDDPDVPLADARALADAATGPSELHTVLGAGHWLRADPRVIAILVGWLERRH